MPIVASSVTEAELFAVTCCAQDMLFKMRVLESMGLKVKKTMTLKVDNKGAKDLCDNWSVGGRALRIYVITGASEEELGMWKSSKCLYEN
jgi:hypothetical protein